jgi:phosphohistidine phosphatase
MQICLLRHAKAELNFSPNPKVDAARVLTPEGKRKMRKIAAGMAALDLKFDLILSSPYARARQTAELAARALDEMDRLAFTDQLAVMAQPADLLTELCARHSPLQSILLVGHEPFLGELASLLLTGHKNTLQVPFKKAGLLCLTVEKLAKGKCAALDWFLTPGQLVALG